MEPVSYNCSAEMWSSCEEGSYVRLMVWSITQLEAREKKQVPVSGSPKDGCLRHPRCSHFLPPKVDTC